MTAAQDRLAEFSDAPGTARQRRCIVTGDVLCEARLLRFVAGPDGAVHPDAEAKLPGRGLWVRAERALVERAAAKGLFSRAAKAPLKAGADLAARAEERLAARMLAHLGLARRAGEMILGFDQIEKALRGEAQDRPPAVLAEASEAAENGRRKLQSAALAHGLAPFVIGAFGIAELSLALGRENVVHAAVKAGRIAERLVIDAGRLAGFRPLGSWTWAGFSEGADVQAG